MSELVHGAGLLAMALGVVVLPHSPSDARAEQGNSEASTPAAARRSSKSTCKYEELTATQLTAALQETSLVYFPVGSLEFHGPHLPLGMDTIHAYEFCLRAAEQTGGVVLPPTYWGAHGHVGWPGSLLVSESTFRSIVQDVFTLLAEQDVRLVVATTGHWPTKQGVIIAEIARQSMKKHPQTRILVLDPYGCNPADRGADHGGKKETSIMLALRPKLVHVDKLPEGGRAPKGITKGAADGNRAFGEEYLSASVRSYVRIVSKALNEGK